MTRDWTLSNIIAPRPSLHHPLTKDPELAKYVEGLNLREQEELERILQGGDR